MLLKNQYFLTLINSRDIKNNYILPWIKLEQLRISWKAQKDQVNIIFQSKIFESLARFLTELCASGF